MAYKKEELNVNDTRCIAYSCENPKYFLIQPVDENDIKGMQSFAGEKFGFR